MRLRAIICTVLLLLVSGMVLLPALPAQAEDNPAYVPIRIAFTHDLHSYFLPHPVVDSKGAVQIAGGYAPLAATIDASKQDAPGAFLLLDAGDFAMGTLFQTLYRSHALELRLMGRMGYEFSTFGNHEFDTDSEGAAEMLNAARASGDPLPQILSSNIGFKPGQENTSGFKESMANFPVQDYAVVEKNGLKIGIFGIIGKDAAQVTVLGKDLEFKDAILEASRVVSVLRDKEKADVIICLSHSGTRSAPAKSEDLLLAQAVPDIDVIISGHTHTVLEEPIKSGKTIIGSCGSYGSYLGVMDINYTPGQGARLANYQLVKINNEIAGKPDISQLIEKDQVLVDQEFLSRYGYVSGQEIAESDFNLETLEDIYAKPRETALGDLIADSYRYAVEKAEGPGYQYLNVAVQAQGEIRDSITAGPVRINDVFRVLSLGLGPDDTVGYPLVGIYLTGAEIKNCLEIEATVAPLKGNNDYRMQVSGVLFKYNPNRLPFNRVYDVLISTPEGGYNEMKDDQLYRVCASYYSASMLGKMGDQTYGLVAVTPKNSRGEALASIDDAVIDADYVQAGVQELKQWPALAAYLQSMPDTDQDGIPNLQARYRQAAGRYAALPSWNLINLLEEPNKITLGLLGIMVVLAVTLVSLGRWMRWRKGRK